MAYPGTKSPPNKIPKSSDGCTDLPQAEGSKHIHCEKLDFVRGDPAELKSANGPTAPTSRQYTRDYSKNRPEPDDTDLITEALGRSPYRI